MNNFVYSHLETLLTGMLNDSDSESRQILGPIINQWLSQFNITDNYEPWNDLSIDLGSIFFRLRNRHKLETYRNDYKNLRLSDLIGCLHFGVNDRAKSMIDDSIINMAVENYFSLITDVIKINEKPLEIYQDEYYKFIEQLKHVCEDDKFLQGLREITRRIEDQLHSMLLDCATNVEGVEQKLNELCDRKKLSSIFWNNQAIKSLISRTRNSSKSLDDVIGDGLIVDKEPDFTSGDFDDSNTEIERVSNMLGSLADVLDRYMSELNSQNSKFSSNNYSRFLSFVELNFSSYLEAEKWLLQTPTANYSHLINASSFQDILNPNKSAWHSENPLEIEHEVAWSGQSLQVRKFVDSFLKNSSDCTSNLPSEISQSVRHVWKIKFFNHFLLFNYFQMAHIFLYSLDATIYQSDAAPNFLKKHISYKDSQLSWSFLVEIIPKFELGSSYDSERLIKDKLMSNFYRNRNIAQDYMKASSNDIQQQLFSEEPI